MEAKDKKRCTAIILAAGQGRRMGADVQKQYIELEGKPVIYYTLKALAFKVYSFVQYTL